MCKWWLNENDTTPGFAHLSDTVKCQYIVESMNYYHRYVTRGNVNGLIYHNAVDYVALDTDTIHLMSQFLSVIDYLDSERFFRTPISINMLRTLGCIFPESHVDKAVLYSTEDLVYNLRFVFQQIQTADVLSNVALLLRALVMLNPFADYSWFMTNALVNYYLTLNNLPPIFFVDEHTVVKIVNLIDKSREEDNIQYLTDFIIDEMVYVYPIGNDYTQEEICAIRTIAPIVFKDIPDDKLWDICGGLLHICRNV